jgi:hypothetical protein
MTRSSGGMSGFSVPVYEGHERGAFTNEHSSTKMHINHFLCGILKSEVNWDS